MGCEYPIRFCLISAEKWAVNTHISAGKSLGCEYSLEAEYNKMKIISSSEKVGFSYVDSMYESCKCFLRVWWIFNQTKRRDLTHLLILVVFIVFIATIYQPNERVVRPLSPSRALR